MAHVLCTAAPPEVRSENVCGARWREFGDDVNGYATLSSGATAVVVLEPRHDQG
jgi:hypothetical protein